MIPTVTETATATTAASSEAWVGQPTMVLTNIELALPTGMPDDPAHQAQHHGLDEELVQDVGRVGADGHPQSDLAGPLGDGDEHDVHDAHAAHHQRNGRHRQCPGPESMPTTRLKTLETSALS